ncbi:hypothetical protein Y032_0015g2576 [Ancylostoma ceylanicum]|nr:hypothetical protein Y032_0015g2576 [Ancylostoma ceylanicum]
MSFTFTLILVHSRSPALFRATCLPLRESSLNMNVVIRYILVYSLVTACLAQAEFDATECNKTKECVRAPEGCTSNDDCMISFSYRMDGDKLEMEISGKPSIKEDAYVAVAFSNDTLMGNDLVVFCAKDKDKVFAGVGIHGNRKKIEILDNKGIQEVLTANQSNGTYYCKVRQVLKRTNEDPYSLDKSYNILLATGPYNNGSWKSHGKNFFRMAETSLTAVNETGEAGNATTTPEVKKDTRKTFQGMILIIVVATTALLDRIKLASYPSRTFRKSSLGMLNKHTFVYSFITTCLVQAKFDATECGKSKGCVRAPEWCMSNEDCEISFSYKVVDGNKLEMEISGKLSTREESYVAVGFSNDARMGNDLVVFCAKDENKIFVGLGIHGNRTKIEKLDNKAVQEELSATEEDGEYYCKWRQVQKRGSDDIYSLDKSYHILMAHGPYVLGSMKYHGENAFALPETSLTAFGGAGGAAAKSGAQKGTVKSAERLIAFEGMVSVIVVTTAASLVWM